MVFLYLRFTRKLKRTNSLGHPSEIFSFFKRLFIKVYPSSLNDDPSGKVIGDKKSLAFSRHKVSFFCMRSLSLKPE